MRPIALDLFCGAGGASQGLHNAGFDVVGVDINAQPNHPGSRGVPGFTFIQADATRFPLHDYDFIWASPPCQRYIRSGLVNKKKAPDLLGPMRERLEQSGTPWAIENVPGAPMRSDVTLCGSMFGLPLRRHRWFELNWGTRGLNPPPPCDHSSPVVGVYGNPHGKRGAWPGMLPGTPESWSKAMGIDWMTTKELSQAIPPAYGEWIGRYAIRMLPRLAYVGG